MMEDNRCQVCMLDIKDTLTDIRSEIKDLSKGYHSLDKRLSIFTTKVTLISSVLASIGAFVMNYILKN